MNIDEVPEEHWMLLDKDREVLFHSKDLNVIKEVIEKSVKDLVITMERKYSGLIF